MIVDCKECNLILDPLCICPDLPDLKGLIPFDDSMNTAQMMYGIDTMAVLGWSLISFTLDKTGVVSSLGGGDDTKCMSPSAGYDCVTGGWKED